jgi:hypothetical protein
MSGEGARLRGEAIFIDKSVDKELRTKVESFLNAAVRTLNISRACRALLGNCKWTSASCLGGRVH